VIQRIQVRALVRKDNRILLLKRVSGKDALVGKYELPGGRVGYNEQPEDALNRHVMEATGLEVQSSYLSDVFTYVDADNSDTQYAVIFYVVGVSGSKSDVKLGQKYGKYSWKKPNDVPLETLTELSRLLLHLQSEKPGASAMVDGFKIQSDVQYTENKKQGVASVFSDGGSRGNPGPSAAGYVIKDATNELLYEGGAYLGITTNNQAEYHGVRLGLEKAKELGMKSVDCYVDSMLVVNQLNGAYVIRNRELWPIHERIKELIAQFDKVSFRHVRREYNQEADGMVNKILDARLKKSL